MSQTPELPPSHPSRPPVAFTVGADGTRPTNAGASGGIPSARFARTLPPPPAKSFFPTVERSERRLALSAFFSLFGILTAHTMLETARDTLFLSRLPLGRLPYVYLAIAALSALLVRVAGGGGTPRGHEAAGDLAARADLRGGGRRGLLGAQHQPLARDLLRSVHLERHLRFVGRS